MQSAYRKYHSTETALICLLNNIQRTIDDQLNSFFFVSLNSFFEIKGMLWYVAIATATFSSVKTTCYFYMSRYHIFLWKQTWYLVDGYIIINNIIIGRGWVVSGKQANIDPRDTDNKQLLDEAFVISGITKVEVTTISWAEAEAETLTKNLIIPDITKSKSNNSFIIHCIDKNRET